MLPKIRLSALLAAALGLAMTLSVAVPADAKNNPKSAAKKVADESAQADEESDEAGDGESDGDAEASGEGDETASPSLRRGNRMEFDARLIRGEGAGSGAVFLFQRAQRPLPSMIHKRTSFLRETVDTLLGDSWAEKFDDAQSQNAQTD